MKRSNTSDCKSDGLCLRRFESYTLHQFRMTKKLLIALAGLIAFITALIFTYETTQSAPLDCNLPSYVEVYYPTFESTIGPCTYLQRVVADLILVFIFPILLLWPVTLVMILYFIAALFINRSLRKINYSPIIISVIFSVLFWFIFLAADAISSNSI